MRRSDGFLPSGLLPERPPSRIVETADRRSDSEYT